MKRIVAGLLLFSALGMFAACSFTLSGASIPPEMKTVNIPTFENNAPLVKTTLSQDMTEALKARIRSQTALSITTSAEADGVFTGNIISYSAAPVSVQSTGNPNQPPLANASRLTIVVHIKYTYKKDKKLDFEQDFTRYGDYTGDLASKEAGLVATINKQLTEDIFNKAFANWE
ncbi:LPS assembly lipoprotein LptE [Mucilaginibacter myungsuensis]|uniref:LptE family protein n=1 Tax=Mucilaginibacter myungsuensis TaxID=649104 RepID=A0A929L2U4_9SPHI|nr:LptE family protein [Mucilaginibacter myungsuensis]MBE9663434.1 LptE family protein [Mucilaginibacter myungsuensis]MDN3600172.1 LptE family protein [Mucilaginibacter myungsuensis]